MTNHKHKGVVARIGRVAPKKFIERSKLSPVKNSLTLRSALFASVLAVSYVPMASASTLDMTHSFLGGGPDTGNNVTSGLVNPGTYTFEHDINFTNTNGPVSFTDTFAFTVSPGYATGSASSVSFKNLLGINNLQIQLVDAANTVLATGTQGSTALGTTVFSFTFFDEAALTTGPYDLKVTGSVFGTGGGSYSGDLNVAPVPIPAAAWLFGSGLIGLTGLSRKRIAA